MLCDFKPLTFWLNVFFANCLQETIFWAGDNSRPYGDYSPSMDHETMFFPDDSPFFQAGSAVLTVALYFESYGVGSV